MKPKTRRSILTATSALLLAPSAFAVDGTWSNTAGGSWNTDANWVANAIADGAGFTANFSADVPTTNTTITLDGARTIGNLTFSDADAGTAGSWILGNGSEGPLTLDAGPSSPTITVNALGSGKNVQILATLEGANGFTKDGSGTLVLNNNTNTIGGPVVVSAGLLSVQSKPLTNVSSVALNGGTLVVATATGNAIGPNNNDVTISFNGGTLQYNVDSPATDYSARFSTDPNQNYRILVISASGTPRVVTFSSNLASEGGTLTKLSTGTLVLAEANTFSGATTVSAGTLELSNALALQNSPIDTAASAAGSATSGLVLTGVASPTFGGLTGGKALADLFDTDSGNYGSVTNVTLNPGTGADHSYTGVIADGATGMTLTKTGAGRQVLGAANTYSGGTILGAGTLNYGNASALSNGPISYTGGAILQAGVATTLANDISVASTITGTVGTAGFATTLSGAITGDGTLAKGGAGVLTLSGGEANTIAGGFRVASGRLNVTDGLSLTNAGPVTVLSGGSLNYSKNFELGNNLTNAITLSGPGDGTLGALNLQGNVDASGPITLDNDSTISHNFNNATISGSITGTNRSLTLTTVNSAQPGMVVSGPISLGTGGITVNAAGGSNTVTLSGNNSYTGETHVVSGTLVLAGDARINNSGTVRIDSGAILQLDFTGTNAVGALFLPGDPNPKPNGTYGSLTSTADNKSADFAGNGILEVGAPVNNYASWAASQTPPVTGGPNGDDNNNGVSNLIEYALIDGGERGTLSGNTITFTKRGAPFGGDVTYAIETSGDLGISDPWTTATPDVNDAATISYTLQNPGDNFARLKVVQTTP